MASLAQREKKRSIRITSPRPPPVEIVRTMRHAVETMGIMRGMTLQPIYPADDDVVLSGMTEIKNEIPDVVVDLKYRGRDNFTGTDVYGGLRRAFLQPAAVEKLGRARALLRDRAPSLTFLIWDAARPVRAQRILFDVVRGTTEEKYVADPDGRTGSMHSYGCALDLTLVDASSKTEVDMGTPYDFFGEISEPREEMRLFKSGQLSSVAYANRLLLREIMVRAGFTPIGYEWWHFNAFDDDTVLARFTKIP